jgi:membrane protein YfhO
MLVAVADLSIAHHDLNPTAPAAFYQYRTDVLRYLPGDPRVFVWDYVEHRPPAQPPLLPELMQVREGWPPHLGRTLGLQAYLYPPSYARWRLHGSFDRDLLGLTPGYVAELVALLSRLHGTPAYPHLLRLGAVDAVLALHDETPAGLRPLGVVDAPFRVPVRAFAVPDPRPRAYLVGEAVVVAEREPALRLLLDPRFDVSRRVVLSEGTEVSAAAPLQGTLQVTHDAPDRFEAETDLDRPGFLVRVATYDTGWHVHLDGGPAPLLRANYAFQAVALPAGRHHVSIAYRPRPIVAGLLLSALALPAVAALFIRQWRLPRPSARSAGDPRAA